MNLKETLEKFEKALSEFCDKEKYLLENNLSERCVAHKLAQYLEEEFKTHFHVDCEYNRQYDSEKIEQAIKRIHIPREVLTEISIDRFNKNDTYSVYPDIIVHKRESENNHLIIEIKKSSNDCKIDKVFDEVKLKKFTENPPEHIAHDSKLPISLAYKLGIYLEIGVEKSIGSNCLKFFQNGNEVEANKITDWA